MDQAAMSDNTEYKLAPSPPTDDSRTEKRPCLIMIRGDFIGQVYELEKDVIMIGRSDDADLVISDISISRKHAMTVRKADGFYLSDLGSTNGSWVNKVPARGSVKLEEGDKVTLGEVVFKFSFQDEDDTQYHLMLRNMAVKDGLTRIYNKRYFTEILGKEFDYNRRNQVGLALIMFDIDHFKQINDTWGHPAGDFILRSLARMIDREARGYDLFARFGGEEFVLLLRGVPLRSAVALADRIRYLIESNVFRYEGEELRVTISLGVTWWSGDDRFHSPDELVESVDRHLYDAKRAGRNCIRHDSLEP